MIKAIIFDAGGVLFNSKESLFNATINYLASETGRSKEEVGKVYRGIIKEIEYKKVDKKYLWESLMDKLSVSIPFSGQNPIEEGFKDFKLNEKAFFLIEKLKKNYQLAIVSNANSIEADTQEARSMYGHFDVVILSFQLGIRKPDEKIYQVAIEKLGVASNEVVFVDDSEENIEAAKKFGMVGLLFETESQLEEDLKKVGVQSNL